MIADVTNARERRDWDALKPLLHPYLHWTFASGRTIRGRTQLLAQLRAGATIVSPVSYELRDGQIYRWLEEAEVK